ncbi:MAG TPA: prepilin peptidase [Oscillospiraceae bacterium]|nr:prepilin peptidase [Oscillospiraceae bacterium]
MPLPLYGAVPYLLAALAGAALSPLFDRVENSLAAARNLEIKPPSGRGRAVSAAACALLFPLAYHAAFSPGNLAFLLLTLSLCYLATRFDLKYRIIPNEIICCMLVCAPLFCLMGCTGATLGSSIAGFFGAGALFLLPFLFGGKVGGGDVKLAAGIGLCAGFAGAMTVLLFMGVLILLYSLVSRGNILSAFRQFVPMGPFVTAAYVLLLIR